MTASLANVSFSVLERLPKPRSLWELRRALGFSPTQHVFRELQSRGVVLGELHALEMFGGTGFLHTKDYAAMVSSLEVWELNPECKKALQRNVPTATIKIADAYAELKRMAKRYSLIVMDAPTACHGADGEHCEHFDLFPDVLRIAEPEATFIVNVVPRLTTVDQRRNERRRLFYGVDDPMSIPLSDMVRGYARILSVNGFVLKWHYSRKRTFSSRIYYLVLHVQRGVAGSE